MEVKNSDNAIVKRRKEFFHEKKKTTTTKTNVCEWVTTESAKWKWKYEQHEVECIFITEKCVNWHQLRIQYHMYIVQNVIPLS